MKKRMRKAVAIAATAAMVGSLPAGAVTAQAADDDITIGVSIWSSTDVLGSQSKKIIDKAADALGVNVIMLTRATYLSRLQLLLNSFAQQDVTVS